MFEKLAPTELVVAIAGSQRQESMLVAQRMAAIAELLAQRTAEVEAEDPDAGYMIVTGFQRTTAEVAAACNLSAMAASVMVSHAQILAERLPNVAAVLAAGDTDWRTVQLVITRTELVRDWVIERLDANLAERLSKWHSWSRRRIVNAVDAMVRGMDPDAIRERVRAEDRRHLDITALGDGTVKVDGIVAVEAGVALDTRLTELANAVCRDDPRSIAQRRADAMKAWSEGRNLDCLCGADDCPNRSNELVAPTRMVINVIAGQQTVFDGGCQPGYIEGYGVIDAELLRSIAKEATLRLIEEPTVSPAEALRYQPTAALERYVRMRDLTCRFPGCDRPAVVCDLDHTIPFNHADPRKGGLTVAYNLKCVCRQHDLNSHSKDRGCSVHESDRQHAPGGPQRAPRAAGQGGSQLVTEGRRGLITDPLPQRYGPLDFGTGDERIRIKLLGVEANRTDVVVTTGGLVALLQIG